MLWKLASLIEENIDRMATIESIDNGLKKSLALKFVQTSANRIRYFAGWADKVHGKVMMDEPGFFNFTRHEPFGVTG